MLNPDLLCLCKQCRSKSVGFWSGSALFAIQYDYDFMSTMWIKESDWLKIRSGRGILIYSAWQELNFEQAHFFFQIRNYFQ